MQGREMGLDGKALRLGQGQPALGLGVARALDPIVEIGLLLFGELEKNAVRTDFHMRVMS